MLYYIVVVVVLWKEAYRFRHPLIYRRMDRKKIVYDLYKMLYTITYIDAIWTQKKKSCEKITSDMRDRIWSSPSTHHPKDHIEIYIYLPCGHFLWPDTVI